MRIVTESEDGNRFNLVETFNDGSVISRLANIARLRPYVERGGLPPSESAERAAANVQDDFEAEIQKWNEARIHKKAPRHRLAMGVHPELLRRTDPNLIDVAFDAKEFYIECLTDFKFEKEKNLYSYFVKWLGYRPIYNTWEDEDTLPKPFVIEFWNDISSRDPKAYEQRLIWLEKPKTKTKPSKESRAKSPKLVVELTPYNSDSDEDVERPVQTAPVVPVNNQVEERRSRRLKDKVLMISADANFHYDDIEPGQP